MDGTTVLGLIAFLAAFLAAVCLVIFFAAFIQTFSIRRRSRGLYDKNDQYGARLLRNGIYPFKPFAKKLLKIEIIRKRINDGIEVLIPSQFTTDAVSLCSLVCFVLLLIMLAGWLVGGSLVVGLLLFAGAFTAAVSYLQHKKEKRDESMRESIPDALRSMSVCSHAGLSLQQTFRQVASEIDEPLGLLFKKADNDLETGYSIETALQEFRKSSHVSELVFISVALDVQHRAGGSLRQVLDAARDSVESELELKRKLRVQTAQAKLSARIVSLMPFVLIAVFSFLSPGFLDPFFQSFLGIMLLSLAVIMQISGILMVRRMLHVEVN